MIHAAVYAARKDVQSVVHTTPTACCRSRSPRSRCGPSCTPRRDRCRDSRSGHPHEVWRHRHARALARAGSRLAAALGNNTCALLRGHGAVVVGASIERAVLTAIYLQVNAKVLLQALQLGPPEALSPEEIARSSETQFSPLALDRSWEYFYRAPASMPAERLMAAPAGSEQTADLSTNSCSGSVRLDSRVVRVARTRADGASALALRRSSHGRSGSLELRMRSLKMPWGSHNRRSPFGITSTVLNESWRRALLWYVDSRRCRPESSAAARAVCRGDLFRRFVRGTHTLSVSPTFGTYSSLPCVDRARLGWRAFDGPREPVRSRPCPPPS